MLDNTELTKPDVDLESLLRQLEELKQEKDDLELMLETTTEHATRVEDELQAQNEKVLQSLVALQAAQAQIELLREQEQKYLEAVKSELQIGRQIQADFLPETLPELPGWELDARFKPAREVAGDFYDVFELPGHRVGLVIADVCDKGVGAALFMALIRSLIRVLAQQTADRLKGYNSSVTGSRLLVELPGDKGQPSLILSADTVEVLSAVMLANEYITDNHGRANMFATLFFGVLDGQANTVCYINGGHDAPIHLGQTVKGRLPLSGPAVGVLPGARYKIRQIELEPEDMLIAYTDGVPEARSPEGKLFGEKRLLDLLEQCRADGVTSVVTLLDRISEEVQTYVADAEPSDDITMLAVRRIGSTNQ